MAEAMAPPLGLTCAASSAMPSSRNTAKAWAAKASFNSMMSKSLIVRPVRRQQLLGGGHRPHAHDPRRHAGRGIAQDPARGVRPWLLHRVFRRDDQRGGAIIDAGRVARRHRATVAHHRLQLRQVPPACRVRARDARPGRRLPVRSSRPATSPARSRPRNSPAPAPHRARCWLRKAKASWSARLT